MGTDRHNESGPLSVPVRLHYAAALTAVASIPLFIATAVFFPHLMDALAKHIVWIGLLLFGVGFAISPTVARHIKLP